MELISKLNIDGTFLSKLGHSNLVLLEPIGIFVGHTVMKF